MNGIVRRLTALSVLWSMLEILMPQGRQQAAVRMTMGVLMMTALMSSAGQLLGQPASWPAWTERTAQAARQTHQQAYIRAMANQVESYCVRQAQKAGYGAQAAVWMRMDGGLEKIGLKLWKEGTVLMSPQELIRHLEQMLQAESGCIQLEAP